MNIVADTIPTQICVLDESGHIFSVNEAWTNFAANNGLPNFKWVGVDYVGTLERVVGSDRPLALEIASAIRESLLGKSVHKSWKYLCQSKGVDHFFDVTLTTLSGQDGVRPVLVYDEITEAETLSQSHARTLHQTVEVLSAVIEQRDAYTAGHQHRVAELSKLIGSKMQLSESRLTGLWLAASIHDLGKIHIPAEYLAKPARLTASEFSIIKEHSRVGYEIIKNVNFDWPIAEMILQHHERWNGTGYPNGLKQDAIILEARIIGVADVFEAIATHRPYRPSLGPDAALVELLSNRGVLYDPAVVDACVNVIKVDLFKFRL